MNDVPHKPRSWYSKFAAAFAGCKQGIRGQSSFFVHFFVAALVIVTATILRASFLEWCLLALCIQGVLVAEMFNSAIEAVVDLVSPNYHPLAKFAKDISAGAVLVTTIMAIVVGAMIALGEDQWERMRINLTTHEWGLPVAARYVGGLILVFIVVIVGKGIGKHGQVLRGGLVSGHAAIGFFFATSMMP